MAANKLGQIKKLINSHKRKTKNAPTADELVNHMEQLMADLEKTAEDAGRVQAFHEASTENIRQKNEEIKSIRCARNAFLWISGFLSVGILLAFYFILLCPESKWKLSTFNGVAAEVAFISASFLSAIGLIGIILRGLMRQQEDKESNIPYDIIKFFLEFTNRHP